MAYPPALKIAASLLKNNVPVKEIMQSTGLTKREVEELAGKK
jgi:hypothetical protein